MNRLQKKYSYCTGMGVELVPNEPRFWNFIGELRADEKVQYGFVEQLTKFNEENQKAYMEKYANCYWILIESYGSSYHNESTRITPLGFIGVVNNDIRLCVEPLAQCCGFGKCMVDELKKVSDLSNAIAKTKHDNIASQKVFLACGFTQFNEDENFKYYKL